jgi:hypothetical protein
MTVTLAIIFRKVSTRTDVMDIIYTSSYRP